jgi:mannose-1-phosphate guanylyltransferase
MNIDNRYVIIMAGGVGSRFWPLSRQNKPKQFLDILDSGETLLQQTFRRFKSFCPEDHIYIVTSAQHKQLAEEQLGINPERILSEPMRRNTAPCITYGTFRIMKDNPDAVIAVTPSDHLILKDKVFKDVMEKAYDFAAKNNALLTLGIKPDRPETGYGYIQANEKKKVEGYDKLLKVKTFTEKPDLELAKVFIESGDFYWNSGIFIWNGKSILASLEKHLPDLYSAFDDGKESLCTDKEAGFIAHTYAACGSISIDYGIMEKADNVYVIMCSDLGWSDLGTWTSLSEHASTDKNGNAIVRGEVFSFENSGNIVSISPNKVAVLQGLKDYIIINTDDVLLIVKKEDEQNIKHYLDSIKKRTHEKYQ